MDRWQAIDSFWNSFGIPAYDENSVPDDAQFPYITYEAKTSGFEDSIDLHASIWYRSTSWKDISNKSDEIYNTVYPSFSRSIDGGYMYVYPGAPFAQRMNEPGDENTRRIYISVNVEFMV